jgi:hypothetical protein
VLFTRSFPRSPRSRRPIGLGRKVDLEGVYYAPRVHARLVSLGTLEGQGQDVRLRDGEMELRDRDGDLFANVAKVNNFYPMGTK